MNPELIVPGTAHCIHGLKCLETRQISAQFPVLVLRSTISVPWDYFATLDPHSLIFKMPAMSSPL